MIAAIYARKSTDQTGVADEQKSVARQVDHARVYATRKGWTVADEHVYVDDGISGAEFAKRPGFLRLMNVLKPRSPFQVLIMSEESRLGREAIETAYALKQLITAGVRVFFYLEDRERTLDSPTDKIMLSLTAFADELERERARQRTYDALARKARAGHVAGGRMFGYENVEILGANGARSHVERRIREPEATVVRWIFQFCADGLGVKGIAKRLNEEGAPAPRAQQGRLVAWAASSVREILFREIYRGEYVWSRKAKRDRWGRHHVMPRPESDWIRRSAPELRIVSDEAWTAAHRRLDSARAIYLRGTGGKAFGRPALGNPSKYLLTNLALCGCCGGPLKALSRGSTPTARRHFYGCAWYHDRGRRFCTNNADVPMEEADGIVLEALLDDIIDQSVVRDAVDEALSLIGGAAASSRLESLESDLAKVNRNRAALVAAVARGESLLDALRACDQRRRELEAERDAMRAQTGYRARAIGTLRDELLALATSWRRVLVDDPTHARPIVSSLLKGRVQVKALGPKQWEVRGEGSLVGLFSKVVPLGMVTRAGIEPAAP